MRTKFAKANVLAMGLLIVSLILVVGNYMKFFAFLNASKGAGSDEIKVILFDVFGTVVDWRNSMVKSFSHAFAEKGISDIDTETFVEDLASAYADNMDLISEGKMNFQTVDQLNQVALRKTLKAYHINHYFSNTERAEMSLVWHKLEPWPDSVNGINQLKNNYKVGTLSNGNIALLNDLAKYSKIDWDYIISGEHFHMYKPNSQVYIKAAKKLGLKPSQILLVASHKYDLKAAKAIGYKTAYIFRPYESRTVKESQKPKPKEFDLGVSSLEELSAELNNRNASIYMKL